MVSNNVSSDHNMDKEDLISKIVLGEITGKNQAIHAYDKMIWTIRTGFLTLFFAGWGILLKSIVDSASRSHSNMHPVLIAMLLVSIALSLGGLIIDQNYVRRKFRVIYALDSLLSIILRKGIQIVNTPNEIVNYIQVSGDKDDTDYKKASGYNPAWKVGLAIYMIPVIIAVISVALLWDIIGD